MNPIATIMTVCGVYAERNAAAANGAIVPRMPISDDCATA